MTVKIGLDVGILWVHYPTDDFIPVREVICVSKVLIYKYRKSGVPFNGHVP